MREETVGALLVAGSAVGFGTLAIFGTLAEAAGLGRPPLLFFRFIVGGRALSTTASASVLTAHVLAVATALLGLRWVLRGATLPTGPTQWGVVVGIGVLGTGVPLVLLYEGLGALQANRASVLGTAEPVTTVALGVLLLGEPLTPETAVGGALVLAGVLLSQVEAPWTTISRLVPGG